MHATDDLARISSLTIARAAAQSQGSGARGRVVTETQLLAAVEAAVADLIASPVRSRLNLADAFEPALADRAVARGGKAMVFRGDGTVEAV